MKAKLWITTAIKNNSDSLNAYILKSKMFQNKNITEDKGIFCTTIR